MKFLNSFIDFLRDVRVPMEKVESIKKAMETKDSFHTTYFNPDRQKAYNYIVADPFLVKTVVETYYYDFVLFNYTDLCFPSS